MNHPIYYGDVLISINFQYTLLKRLIFIKSLLAPKCGGDEQIKYYCDQLLKQTFVFSKLLPLPDLNIYSKTSVATLAYVHKFLYQRSRQKHNEAI